MRGGALRHLVTFQTATISRNDFGEPIQSWSDLSETWARVEPLAGKERFAAMQQQADADYRITCRWHSDIANLAPEDRATWGNYIFDIKAVLNIEGRNRELHVYARSHLEESATLVVNGGVYVVNGGVQVVNS